MASESTLRNNVVSWCEKYLGIKEGSTQHKEIINIFNDSGLCTRYKMTTSDAWCATFVSAAFISQDLTSKCFPCVECSCANMITKAKNAGLWVEDDSYKPSKGDVILYDWQDSGSGDNTGTPDHVGIVSSVSGSSFKVIEGNKSDTVGYRSMTVNGKYIRGYISPDYAAASSSSGTTSGTGKTSTGSGTTSSSKTYMTYKTTANLNYRTGAGTSYAVKGTIKKGNTVQVEDGYSKSADGYTWYRVKISGNEYYMASKYLTKSSSSSSSSLPTYKTGSTYTLQVDKLAVRTGAGTSNSKKSKSQLTSDGQKHAYSDGSLKKGTKVTCKGTKTVSGNVWMQIPSGWCAAYYNGKYYIK